MDNKTDMATLTKVKKWQVFSILGGVSVWITSATAKDFGTDLGLLMTYLEKHDAMYMVENFFVALAEDDEKRAKIFRLSTFLEYLSEGEEEEEEDV